MSVIPAHRRITCLRAAWLYNKVLAQGRGEKKEQEGGERMLSLVIVVLSRGITKGVERTLVFLWDTIGCSHV